MTADERAWCPYCNEHHYDQSWEAAVRFSEEICAPDGEGVSNDV